MKDILGGETEREAPGDELALDLPGLPVAVGNVRADRAGLHYEGRDYSWDRISSLAVRGEKLVAEGRRLYRPSVLLFEASVVPEDARPIEAAWREYLLRKTERDGALRGTAAPARLERKVRLHYVFALILLFNAFLFSYAGLSQLRMANPFERDVVGSLGAFAVPAGIACVSLVILMRAVGTERRGRRLGRDWEHWELRPEGLAVTRGDEKRVLTPSGGDRVFLESDSCVGGERVGLRDLSGQPTLTGLFIAMAERKGVAVRVYDVRELARGFALGLGAGLVPVVVLMAFGNTVAGTAILAAVALIVAALALYYYMSHTRKRRDIPRMLEEGREALRRLGW